MKKYNGFTIVELLIVIVVVAILAAITLWPYSGVQNSANDAAVKQDLAQFAKRIEVVKIDNADEYPATLTSAMGFSFSKSSYGLDDQAYTLRYCYNSSNNQYIFYVRSKSGKYFKVTSSGISQAAATYGWGVCS